MRWPQAARAGGGEAGCGGETEAAFGRIAHYGGGAWSWTRDTDETAGEEHAAIERRGKPGRATFGTTWPGTCGDVVEEASEAKP